MDVATLGAGQRGSVLIADAATGGLVGVFLLGNVEIDRVGVGDAVWPAHAGLLRYQCRTCRTDSIVERSPWIECFGAPFAPFAEIAMRTRFKVLAVVAGVLASGTSSAAMAKYPCAPGYRYHNRVCQPVRHLGYGNPVSGAVSGEAAGAARGAATGGPVGAVVGGALGTASGTLTGTANMLSGR